VIRLKIDSFYVVVLFYLRLRMLRELLNSDSVTDFVLGFSEFGAGALL
jgi:hypothetical protein